ncbi:MAG: acyltransferase [Planctomycetota bacterium]|jgi:phenylacetic acid degradation protein
MPAYEFEGIRPVVAPGACVADTAVLIGDVIIEAGCYVGPGAVLRGDISRLIVRAGANIQDNCVMHSFPGRDVVVEEDGHVGHAAVLHGCTVGRNAMVGIGAVVMDGAVIGAESIVAAMAFVKAGTEVPPRTLVAGIPARVVRPLAGDEIAWKSEGTAIYQYLARRHLATSKLVEPLAQAEADRKRVPELDYAPKHEQP